MKILVPVDGSMHAMEAVKVAADFARTKNARISVVSVVPNIGGMEDHEISPSRKARHMEGFEKQCDEAVKQACEALSSENISTDCAKTVLSSVSIPDAIIDFAEEQRVDLIVMGSRGVSTSSRFKMGSVATQVVKYSPCSVYLVKMLPEK